mmetsp:Transcript_38170/g.50284  ORF Transcript_38170/g.50284 Transcript_38170/m.50284 type:complete len:470 (+) Transcript_38170:315-1724(+)
MPTTKYEAKNLAQNVFSWRGTAFKAVLTRWDWFFLLVWATTLSLLRIFGVLPRESQMEEEWKIFGYVGFLLTFSLVFFLKDCYSKYRENLVMIGSIIGRIKEISATASIIFQDKKKYAETVIRLVNASHHVFFYDLADLPVYLWKKVLVNKGLFTNEEFEVLKSFPDSRYYLCLCWLLKSMEIFFLDLVKDEPESRAIILSKSYHTLLEKTLALRSHYAQLEANEDWEKVPFAYYHLLCVSIYTYLFALGYFASSKIQDPFNPIYLILYFTTCVGFLGLFHIAIELADPFGTDDNDIKVPRFLNSALEGTQMLMFEEFQIDWTSITEEPDFDSVLEEKTAFMTACDRMLQRKREKDLEQRRNLHLKQQQTVALIDFEETLQSVKDELNEFGHALEEHLLKQHKKFLKSKETNKSTKEKLLMSTGEKQNSIHKPGNVVPRSAWMAEGGDSSKDRTYHEAEIVDGGGGNEC